MPNRVESVPPRSSASTIAKPKSTIDQGKVTSPPQKEAGSATDFTVMHPAATLSCLSLPEILDLSEKDLPHNQELGSRAETCLVVGKLLLIFDCSASSDGTLSISKVEAVGIRDMEDEARHIRVAEIPNTEMLLHSVGSSKTQLRLQNGHTEIEIEIKRR